MENSTVIHSTFQLERKLKASPERVFAAFADEATKRRWFFEGNSHALEHHELDFKVGGRERAQMKMGPGTPVAGRTLVNETVYTQLTPDKVHDIAETSFSSMVCSKPAEAVGRTQA